MEGGVLVLANAGLVIVEVREGVLGAVVMRIVVLIDGLRLQP